MYECTTCAKTFTGYESYEQHLQSEKHKKKMFSELKNQNGSSDDSENCIGSSDSKYKCCVCDLSFDSSESYQSHSVTPEHAIKIMLKQAKSNDIPNGAINNEEFNATRCKVEPAYEDSILPELNKPSNLSFGSCQVCSKIFSGPEPYKQHIESQAHKKKVALLQNPASVVGNVFKCEPCNKSFSGDVPYAQHMISDVHKKKLQNIEFAAKYLSDVGSGVQEESEMGRQVDENKLWFCYVCNKQCSGMIPFEQHNAGSTHFKNLKRVQSQKNFVKTDSGMKFMFQGNNFSEGKISEKSENEPQLMNVNHQKDNEERQNYFILPEKMNELKVVTNDELAESVKVIHPEEKINFDELDKSDDSANGDIFKQNENQNNEEFREFQESNENIFDGLKKEFEKKCGVYQTCKVCNVLLFDKDSAAEHYESKEHFEKRWK